MSKSEVKREPVIRVVKRVKADVANVFEKIFVKIASVGFATLFILLFLSSVGECSFNDVWDYIGHGAFDTKNGFFNEVFLLLMIAIALTPSYKMKFWNIGGQGQILIGGLLTATMMLYVPNHSGIIISALILSILSGGLWALIPALFKVKINANETLFTLMMNYVAIQLVAFATHMWNPNAAFSTINPTNQLGYMSPIGNNEYGVIVLVSILLMFFMYIYMHYTKHGYEIEVVGDSLKTAKYAGISTSKVIFRTIFLSGALCGLVGFMYVTGCTHTISTTTSGGYGFTAIIVSWAAQFNPFIMAIISFGIMLFSKGAIGVADATGANQFISQISVGIFLLFLIGSEFFINYRFAFNSKITAKLNETKEKIEKKAPKFVKAINKIQEFGDTFDDRLSKLWETIDNSIREFIEKSKDTLINKFSKKDKASSEVSYQKEEIIENNTEIETKEEN